MYKVVVVWAIVSFLMLPGLKAQEPGFTYYDSLTYSLFQKGDYNGLMKSGNEALHAGFDYYYLRMRLGIAAYEQKRYRLAASHFEKASAFYDNNVVKEYRYYSNLWGGNGLKAQEVVSSMPDSLKERLGISGGALLSAELVAGYLFLNGLYPEDIADPETDGFRIVPGSFTTTGFSLSHRVGKKLILTHQFTYLHRNSKKFTYDLGNSFVDSSYRTNQYQYYLGGGIDLGKQWELTFGGHFAAVNYPFYVDADNSDSLVYRKTSKWATDFLFSASVLKNYSRFSLEAEMVVLRMAGEWSYEPTAILRLYPFANLNLYAQSQFSYLVKKGGGAFFQQKIGFRVFKYLWLEGDYFTGDVSGFSLQNGSMIFNGLEKINTMWGAKAIIPASSKLMLTFGYQNRKQTNYFIESGGAVYNNSANKLDYSLLYISLQWRF